MQQLLPTGRRAEKIQLRRRWVPAEVGVSATANDTERTVLALRSGRFRQGRKLESLLQACFGFGYRVIFFLRALSISVPLSRSFALFLRQGGSISVDLSTAKHRMNSIVWVRDSAFGQKHGVRWSRCSSSLLWRGFQHRRGVYDDGGGRGQNEDVEALMNANWRQQLDPSRVLTHILAQLRGDAGGDVTEISGRAQREGKTTKRKMQILRGTGRKAGKPLCILHCYCCWAKQRAVVMGWSVFIKSVSRLNIVT